MRDWQYKYATLYLKMNGYSIIEKNTGKKLFNWQGKPTEEDYTLSRVQTKITEGKDFYRKTISKRYISYDELKDYGFVITQFVVDKKISSKFGKKGHTISYKISNASNSISEIQKVPDSVVIEINPEENWLRLKGPTIFWNNTYGFSKKKYYQKKPIIKDENYPEHPLEWALLRQNSDWLDNTFDKLKKNKLYGEKIEDYKEVVIPEIPLIFSDNKELVCIPTDSSDVNRIGFYGMPGGGKTVAMTSVMSRVIEKTNDMIININDPLNQYFNCALPVKFINFKKWVEWLGETPKPMPIVNFWFASKDINKYNLDDSFDFILPFPFEILLERWQEIFKGTTFELDKSAKYLSQFKEGLSKCKSVDEIVSILREELESQGIKGWDGMIGKWAGLFHTFYDAKCLDVSWGGKVVWSLYKNNRLVSQGHPIFICMEAGLVPNINTSKAKSYSWFKPLFAEWFRILSRYQEAKDPSKRVRMWVAADELGDIHMVGRGAKDSLSEAFLDLFRQGRPLDIYPLYNIQLIKNLDEPVKKMTGVGVCTRLAHIDERKEIIKMFDINSKELDGIDHMQPLNFIIVSKTPFVVYDRYGRKLPKSKCRRVYRGQLVPPLCNTHQPHKKTKVDITLQDRGVYT